MSNHSMELKDELKVERYKFILQEIHSLNANIHKYITLFQILTTAIIGAIVFVLINWKKLDVPIEIAKIGIRGLYGLLVIVAAFIIFSILSGIFSWFDYRKEEVELLNKAVGDGFRKSPRLSNLWRWYEPYIILFVAIIVLTVIIYTEKIIIPLIR